MTTDGGAQTNPTLGLARRLAPFLVCALIFALPVPTGLDRAQWTYFAIFGGAIAGLVFESAAPGAVGFVAMTAAAVLGLVEKDPAKSLRWALHARADAGLHELCARRLLSV